MGTDFIVHDKADTVGVAVVEDIAAGKELTGWIMETDETIKLKALDAVPLGHKIALKDIKSGDTVLKYGHDVGRVVAALPKPPVATTAPRTAASARRWSDWRIAAALTMVTLGGLSIAVSRRTVDVPYIDSALSSDLERAARDSQSGVSTTETPRASENTATPKASSTPSNETVQLSFGGGVSDLDDTELRELLGALDEIDRAPVALSAEPDHSPVLPSIREGTR